MALYKRGKFWWISINRRGVHIQKSTKLTDKKMARAVEQALYLSGTALDGNGERLTTPTINDEGKKRKIVQGLLQAVYGDDSDRTPLTRIWDEYMATLSVKGKNLCERTIKLKRAEFHALVDWAVNKGITSLDGITATVAKEYSLGFVGKMSDKRRANILMDISSVWNAILSSHPGIINPWPSVSPSVDRIHSTRVGFTIEEEERVLEAAKKVHEQWYIACVIGRNTGLRYGDVCRLERGNIDLEQGILRVQPHKTSTSSGVVVRIPMSTELKLVMTEWISKNPLMTEYDRLMPWMKEHPHKKHRFRAVLEEAGMDHTKYSFHTFRHTLATKLGEKGVSIEVRKKILGHTTDVMADRYNHADSIKEMKSALNKVMV